MTTQPESGKTWIPELGYGDRLRRIRLDLDMDQREFAESIQMNKGTYGHHELSYHVRRGAKLVANSIELRHGVPAWWTLGESPVSEIDDECAARDSNPEPADYVPHLYLPPTG